MPKINKTKIINFLKSEKLFKIIFVSFWIILGAISIVKLYLILPNNLSNDNFLYYYKFFTPDSYDWVNNAKFFENLDSTSIRQPGFTLLIKFFLSLNSLGLIPVLNQTVFLGILYCVYAIITTIAREGIKFKYLALVVTFILFENNYLQLFSNLFLSDYYAIFFYSLSLLLLLKNKYKTSALVLGISWLFQNFSPVTVPMFLLYLFLNQKDKIKFDKSLLITLKKPFIFVCLFLLPNLPWFIYKFILFKSPFYTHLDQVGLLNPNGNSFLYYFVNGTSLFGLLFIPAIVFTVYRFGSVKFRSRTFLLGGLLVISLIFWTILYEWNDRRFLLYLIPVIIPLIFQFITYFNMKTYSYLITILLVFMNTVVYISPAKVDTSIPLTYWEALDFNYQSLNKEGEYEMNISVIRQTPSLKSVIFPNFYFTYQQRNYYRKDDNSLFAQSKKFLDKNYTASEKKLCLDSEKYPYKFYDFNNIVRYETGYKLSELNIDPSCMSI